MGDLEDEVRGRIRELYGSIPKMAEASGIAQNTVYHALDRGLDNTTTRTRNAIFKAIQLDMFGDAIDGSIKKNRGEMMNDVIGETELLDLYRGLDAKHKEMLLDTARAFAAHELKGKEEERLGR